MKKTVKYRMAGLMTAAMITAAAFTASAADVDVYAEGAYTDTDLVVYIYADIKTIDPLVSAGVSINYDPAVFSFVEASKNEEVWYFGEPGATYPYVKPDDSAGTGRVSFILGKLKESAPTEGVDGLRVVLGSATFSHAGAVDFSGITLSYGNDAPAYANFVTNGDSTVDPIVVDDDGFVDMSSVVIHERGDANGDGNRDSRDIRELRKKAGNSDLPVWYDADGSGSVDSRDIRFLRTNI